MPGISHEMTSPPLTGPTPDGVPVRMRSPYIANMVKIRGSSK